MKKLGRSEEQEKFIELNKQFMTEVENGATWNDLRSLIDEMKAIAKNFEHMDMATVIAMDHRNDNSSMERNR
jgi:hypothetical protein